MTHWTILISIILGCAVSIGAHEAATPSPPPSGAGSQEVRRLRHVLIAENEAQAQALKVDPNQGLVQVSPALSALASPALAQRLAHSENQPIQGDLVSSLGNTIE